MERMESRFDNLITGGDLSDLLNEVIPDLIPSALRNFPNQVSEKLHKTFYPILAEFVKNIRVT